MKRVRRSPRPFGFALDGLRKELAPETVLANVQCAWPDVVGPAIAAEAAPTAERGGVLTVSCSAAVWAQELDLMAPAILERVNAILDVGEVTRLRCVAV
jgi:predicted nucleic acid-binding Zn ribbon protein